MRRWAANDWNVAQEHRATSVSEEVVAAPAGPVCPSWPGGPGFGPGRRGARLLGADGTAADARGALRVVSAPDWPAFTTAAPTYEPPDQGHILLRRRFAAIVAEAMAHLAELWPPGRDFTGYKDARTEEDLGYLVEFLAAALFVDDVTLYTDFATWMSAVLGSRGVPVAALDAGMEATGKVLSDLVGGASWPLRFIAAARSELRHPTGAGPDAPG